MNVHAIINTEVGELNAVATDTALIGLHWPQQKRLRHFADPGETVAVDSHAVLSRTRDELHEYFLGQRKTFTVPIATEGSEFDRSVWAMLLSIPFGTRTTYGAMAERIREKSLAQRVGQAVGANPIAIIVPCHRVVGSDGSLTGFAGGIDAKRFLLALEEPDADVSDRLF